MKDMCELGLEKQVSFKHKQVRGRALLVEWAVEAESSNARESMALLVCGQPSSVDGD